VASSSEHGNKTCYVKGGKFLAQLSDC